MKTEEELKNLKAEVEALSQKLRELSEEELSLVTGGSGGHGPEGDFEYYFNDIVIDIPPHNQEGDWRHDKGTDEAA